MLRQLQERYGLDDQQKITSILDNFFDLRRGSMPLREYLNEFVLRFDEAAARAGLQMNDTGKAHLLLKYAGLSEQRVSPDTPVPIWPSEIRN